MKETSYRFMFWVLFFLVCVALISDLESASTFRHAVVMIAMVMVALAVIVTCMAYYVLFYRFRIEERRFERMTKQEREREYLYRVAGLDRINRA